MRIFFIGTVQFSHAVLELLIKEKANIVGVATKAASDFNADFADLTPLCEKYNIPLKYAKDINHPNNVQFIRSTNPDIIYCFGWSSLLKKETLNLPRLGVIGFHPAALPENKGRHPLIWALALGLTETASSFFVMNENADDGNIIAQEKIKIEYEDDAASLYKKMTKAALKQVLVFTKQIQQTGTLTYIKENGQGNHWRKRGKADGRIDFRMSSEAIYNLVRALARPYVGAHIEVKGEDIVVWKTRVEKFEKKNIEPGKVLEVKDNTILIKTYDGAIRLMEHEFGGRLPLENDYLI